MLLMAAECAADAHVAGLEGFVIAADSAADAHDAGFEAL